MENTRKEILRNRIITLSNGKRVANFSSPHDFNFEDGSVLKAVPNEEAEALKVTFEETLTEQADNKVMVELDFSLSKAVKEEMGIWLELEEDGEIDTVFCALPMITALKQSDLSMLLYPFRAIRMEDRIKKLVSITKECI